MNHNINNLYIHETPCEPPAMCELAPTHTWLETHQAKAHNSDPSHPPLFSLDTSILRVSLNLR